MNKIFAMGLVVFTATSLFSSCADDRESNPTLVQPTEFRLNTPISANQLLDLRSSKQLNFVWSHPNATDKGAPLAGAGFYAVQVSKTGKFTTSVAQADADKTGKAVADYIEFDQKFSETSVSLDAKVFDRALNVLYSWGEEENVPAKVELTIRVNARFAGANAPVEDGSVSIASNTVKMTVTPYYLEDAPIALNYIVGNDVAGSWSDNVADAGKGLLPFFPIPNTTYERTTGLGKVDYTGYFPEGAEFKVFSPKYTPNGMNFDWNYAYIAEHGSKGAAYYRNGGGDADNISAPKAGYYTIVIDNVTHSFTMSEASNDIDTSDKGSIGIVGDFNGWNNDLVMNLASKPEVAKNAKHHVWSADLKLDAPSQVKFRANKESKLVWGSSTVLPYGVATKDGGGIKLKKGEYRVYFNDLTGQYNFILKEVKK